MALVLANRVQESATANTTVSFTLTGAVLGFQTFAVIGDTNTTYYSATDTAGNWEVGLGTYSTTGPTLTRTTIYASSNTGSAVTFSGIVNVFVTYPSGKSVNLDASGNVSALGTVSSGTWQGSTIGVAYGGTGVTASSGANSVVLRDANSNITVNRVNQANTSTTAAGGTTALTAASSYIHTLVGTGGQTYTLPDATTLTTGVAFLFNNMATGTLTIQNYATGSVGTIPSGGAGAVFLTDNSTTGGTWDIHAYLPEGVTFGTNAFNLGTSVISGGTWQGGTIQPGYGGTGLTTFVGANNALYSTGASTLTAGTLPVAAGGTGLTTYTLNGVLYASGTGTLTNGSALTFDGTTLGNSKTGVTGTTELLNITRDNSGTFIKLVRNAGSGNAGGLIGADSVGTYYAGNTTANSLYIDNVNTNLQFYVGSSEQMRLTSTGLGIGTSSPSAKLQVNSGSDEFFSFGSTGAGWNYGVIRHVSSGDLGYIGDGVSAVSGGANTDLAIRAQQGGLLFATNGNNIRATLDSSGNLGLGVTPSAWDSTYKAIQVGARSMFYGIGSEANMANNAYYNSGYKYVANSAAGLYTIDANVHKWYNAASGTAGNAITFTQAMTLNASGNLGVGTTTMTRNLNVGGSNAAVGLNLQNSGTSGRNYSIFSTNSSASVVGALGFYDDTAGAYRMVIDSSGNLVLGNTSALGKLDIGLSGATRRLLVTYDDSLVTVKSANSSANPEVLRMVAERIQFNTGSTGSGTEAARIDSSGNLGVGTTSPAARLDVVGSTGILTRAAATQDGVALVGRAGGTSSYEVTLTPTTLTADQTLTLPNETGTVLTTGSPFMINSTTVASSYTIASGQNAMSVGPMTVNSGVTVTVSSGQRWLVL